MQRFFYVLSVGYSVLSLQYWLVVSECHASCMGCVAGGQHKCTSCSDPLAFFKDGRCVSSCGPSHYAVGQNCSGMFASVVDTLYALWMIAWVDEVIPSGMDICLMTDITLCFVTSA